MDSVYYSYGLWAYKTVYEYDDNGNKIKIASYNSDGSLKDRYAMSYKYDDKENQIEQAFYKSNGSLERKYVFNYDGKRNVIDNAAYASDGSFVCRISYEYEFDKNGNWVKRNSFENHSQNFQNGIVQTIAVREIEYY